MKKLIFLTSLIISFLSFSQSESFTITGTKQHWAGGVCCSSGVNYSLRITAKDLDLNDYGIDSIYLDEHVFYENLQISKNKDFIQVNFGLHFNRNGNDFIYEKVLEKISKNNVVILCKKFTKIEVKIGEINTLVHLAYP